MSGFNSDYDIHGNYDDSTAASIYVYTIYIIL
jgi:hypothetical protein